METHRESNGYSTFWVNCTLRVALITSLCCILGCGKRSDGMALASEGCLCSATNWVRFSPPDGTFSVLMPALPTSSVATNHSTGEPLVLHSYIAEPSSTTAFGVVHSSLPSAPNTTDEDAVFDSALAKLLEKDARLVSEEAIAIDDHPGREWVIERYGGPALVSIRFYPDGDNCFQAICVMPKDRTCQIHVREFLDSFRLDTDSGKDTE